MPQLLVNKPLAVSRAFALRQGRRHQRYPLGGGDREGRRRLTGHERPAGPVAFSPSGRILASADGGGLIRLWDVPTGKELCRLTGHRGGGIRALAFSPDGKTLATGGYDRLVVIWDVEELAPRRAQAVGQLTPAQKLRLWGELASDQAEAAYDTKLP
jgi:WD40 repeat protein